MCPECEAFQKSAGGHRSLVEDVAQNLKPVPGSGYYVRHYTCFTCGTQWKFEHDPENSNLGWSLR